MKLPNRLHLVLRLLLNLRSNRVGEVWRWPCRSVHSRRWRRVGWVSARDSGAQIQSREEYSREFARGSRRREGRGEEEEDSLDNPKHSIRTMLSNRTIIESRSSRIFIVNSRESSCSVYYLLALCPLTMGERLTFPRIKATCFSGFITYISPI
jgi:hypothetical protein